MTATTTVDGDVAATGPERPWVRVLPSRVVARLADLALVLVAGATVVAVLALARYLLLLAPWDDFREDARDFLSTIAPLAGVAAAVGFHLYNAVWRVARQGATIGKAQVGLAVRTTGLETPGLGAALLREVVFVPLSLLAGLVALFNGDRRGLHDLASRTRCYSIDASTPPGVLRDIRVYKIVGQIVAVLVVLYGLLWLFGNLIDNLDEQNIRRDFDFLDQPTNFQIQDNEGFDPRQPVRDMVWVGIKNTVLAASVGIVIATVLGVLIGVARLSSNWIVAKLAMLYVETLRNIPPLVIIIFFGFAIFTFGPFPVLSGTSEPWLYKLPFSDSNWLILSNTKWGIPSFASDGNTGLFWFFVVIALLAAIGVWIWRTQNNLRTGKPHHRVLWSLGTFLVVTVLAFLLLQTPYVWSFPEVSENGRRIENGFILNFGWISITLALGLYTASHIAEIIRGSILAVHKGQSEASDALALSGFQKYRFVILPQASRIAIPPTINQYLNLTKNTSLGIAVAYAELTALTKSSIGNGRPAVQSLLILMTVYLFFSITISIVMNIVNRRVQLEGR